MSSQMPLGINGFGFGFPNWYQNQVGLDDMWDMSTYSNPAFGMGTGMGMGMDSSIFGGGFGGGFMGMPSFTGGGDYFQNYQNYQNSMLNNNIAFQQNLRNADLRINAPQEGLLVAANNLREKILSDEQEQIMPAFEAYKESIRQAFGPGTEEEVSNRTITHYQKTFGTALNQDIRNSSKGSFTQGFLQTATFGLADKRTGEDNISSITRQPVSRKEKAKEAVGHGAGAAALTATGLTATRVMLSKMPFIKSLTKFKPFALITLGAAAITGISGWANK